MKLFDEVIVIRRRKAKENLYERKEKLEEIDKKLFNCFLFLLEQNLRIV